MKYFQSLMLFLLVLIIGCSDDKGGDSSSTLIGPGAGGIGGTGTVNFTISHSTLQEGYDADNDGQADDSFYLSASPSVAVKITSVDIGVPNDANFDSVQGDGTTVFAANSKANINETPYFFVSSGQKFTLKFVGKLASNDESFEITSEYTVP